MVNIRKIEICKKFLHKKSSKWQENAQLENEALAKENEILDLQLEAAKLQVEALKGQQQNASK